MRSKNRIIFGYIVIILAVILFGCNSKEGKEVNLNEKVILVGTSGEYSPWCFKKGDDLQGFEVDVWKTIGERSGYKIDFKVSKFSGLMGMLDAGQIDTVAHQISITPEREEKYVFSDTYAYSGYSLVVKKDSSFKSLGDFKGKKIGCVLGGNGEKTLRELNSKNNLNLEIVTYDGTPMEKDVEIGRIDAAWYGSIKAKTTIESENLNLELMESNHVYEVNKYPFKKIEQKADNKDKIEAVNKALESMKKDGKLKEISEKWFNEDITKERE